MCPFCEWKTRPVSETPEADRTDHITTFHRERIAATAAYRRALDAGKPECEARVAYNAALYRPGPGQYARQRSPQLSPA